MIENNVINPIIDSQYEKLVLRKQKLYADLLNSLNEKQFNTLAKYLHINEQIQKKVINTILRNKKR